MVNPYGKVQESFKSYIFGSRMMQSSCFHVFRCIPSHFLYDQITLIVNYVISYLTIFLQFSELNGKVILNVLSY